MRERRWMVCNVHGAPCGQTFATEAEAQTAQRDYPVGCDYHVRPVEIVVRGTPPEPWCFLATPSRTGSQEGTDGE